MEGGFDTDTDDEELFMEDPEFDNQMVQAWAAIKTDPSIYNHVAGELCSAYMLSRARWRKFVGRLPRRMRLERRKRKFAGNKNLRDARKGEAPLKAFMCGECSSYTDICHNRLTRNQESFLLKT